jgi:L-erythro-3,5-diaminohexanoate dehydrogenase
MERHSADAVGVHRVLEPAGVLPQAAWRLDPNPQIRPDEVRVRVTRLNLDAASYTQLHDKHLGDGARVRDEVAGIIASRGKMHNPVTGSGGMLIGVVEQVGPESPLGLSVGDRVATLVSLTLTPLQVTDGLADWDGQSERVPCDGTAILFRRSIVATLPEDMPEDLAMSVNDVCGAPALTARVVRSFVERGVAPTVAVLGGAGKSGSLSLAAARAEGAARTLGVVPFEREAQMLRSSGIADLVALADARDPVAVADAVADALGAPADITIVCVTVPGCEHGAVLATQEGGTIIFFSMATSFTAAALGAEGLAADVTMLIGNGYARGHSAYALDILRTSPAVRALFEARLEGSHR